MPKAYSYIRFSRPEQALGDSLRRQLETARTYADEHGLHLDENFNFRDEGISAFRGAHSETGALSQFLLAIRLGQVKRGDYLLIENLDRLSRQAAMKALSLLNDICEAGVIVVTVMDGRVYSAETLASDTTALLMAVLTFIRANEESTTKADRLRKAWAGKRANIADKPLTSRLPAWVILNRETGKLQLHEERAVIVRRIFSDYVSGSGQHAIAARLNAEGLEPWGVGKQKARQWHSSYIVKMLDSDAVTGTFRPHTLDYSSGKKTRVPGEPVHGYYPPVIDAETFARVRELRDGRNTMKGRKSYQPLQNVFSGVARCPRCGNVLIRVNKSKTWEYLVCSAAKSGVTVEDHNHRFCTGGYNAIPYLPLEDALTEAVQAGRFVAPSDSTRVTEVSARIAEVEATKQQRWTEYRNITEAIKGGAYRADTVTMEDVPRADGSVMSWTIREELEALERSISIHNRELQALKSELEALKPVQIENKVSQLVNAMNLEPIDKATANAALRALCENVTIDPEAKSITFGFRHTADTLSISYRGRK